jgi:hypothetical protein
MIPVIHSDFEDSESYVLIEEKDLKNHEHYKEVVAKFGIRATEGKKSMGNDT